MTPQEWRRVRALFEEALLQDPAAVEGWLARAAADAPALGGEVASLLDHHRRAGQFLATPLGAAADPAGPGALQPGETLGPYTILGEIGRGGMGCVYLAADARLGRRVALKALPSRLAGDPGQRERLRREARAAAALAHPGICTVYALEETDRGLFIATEYIEGQTLREEIAHRGRRSPHDLVTAAHELAAALACAHGRGVTHRDLKPENVMRSGAGRLKILDFGIATAPAAGPFGDREPAPRLTEPGAVVGTPGYMAPEQLRGEPADFRSDIFALGVLLYEYACGVHPFAARDPLAMAARVLEAEPTPLHRLRPDVPPQLAAAVERCLRKRAAERWPSAVELALALAHPGPLPPAGNRAAAWWRAHQLVVIALYAVAAALAWQIKEWTHGAWPHAAASAAFIVTGLAGTINGVVRGHLLFTGWANPGALPAERSRLEAATRAVDLAIAAVLVVAGGLLASTRPLAATLTMALAAAIALARTIVEPATAAAAFDGGRTDD